jgi:hypothetical protein
VFSKLRPLTSQNSAEEVSPELLARLDRIANLLALSHVRDLEQPEKIRVLDAVGYTASEIAAFLNEKPNTISATLYRQRHPKKSAARRRKKPAARRAKR